MYFVIQRLSDECCPLKDLLLTVSANDFHCLIKHPTVTAAAPIKSSSVAVQTDLTWPSGQEMPVQIPHKSIASQTVSPNRLMGGASTASALQLPAATASSSAAKNDSPGKGPSARRPSPSASFKKPIKLNLTKQTKMVDRSSEDPHG